ncbi:MAG: phosphoenolpyruvate--protein phosphotransferase [Nitriliruptoraceae bacterium]
MSTTLSGTAAAPGAALAPAFVLRADAAGATPLPATRRGSADAEVARLEQALKAAEQQLRELAEQVAETAGREEGDIFEAHAEFAADPELASMARESISDGASAERAVSTAFDTFREALAASSSEYLAARADDLVDVRDRVVAILQGREVLVAAPEQRSVIVARELSPSQTASLPRALIAALVTETGSPTSHAAILARSLGIPSVVACEGLLQAVDAAGDGVELAIDGRRGEIVLAPDEQVRREIEERIAEEGRRRSELESIRQRPGQTADGHRVELAANIGSPQDLPPAIEAGAEGSGLVRTEFLFQERRSAPSVDVQVGFYVEVLRAFPGQRVVFRTMDVGADKPLPFVERDPEDNPALGLRGIRLHLARPDLLRDQLRALLRARAAVADEDAGKLAVMFPLVATARELSAAREHLVEVAAEEGIDLDELEVGAMVEVPSAALGAARIAEHADFLSIGSNDLLQYLFAVDRLHGGVAELANPFEPDALALFGQVVEAGHANGAWVGVCGEAASDPVFAAAMVGLGVDELSMTRVAIPEVKDALGRVELETCREAVRAALAEGTDATSVRQLLEDGLASATAED